MYILPYLYYYVYFYQLFGSHLSSKNSVPPLWHFFKHCMSVRTLYLSISLCHSAITYIYFIIMYVSLIVSISMYIHVCCFCVLFSYKFFVYFCVLFFFFCVFCSSNLTSCHATNVYQVFVFDLLAAKFHCDCSRFLTSYLYHKVDNG